ncbi:MAG: DUF3822 family protein [Bacteroidota bacterium]
MGIVNTDIVEDNFAKRNSSSYDLSILVGMDRFSYVIVNGDKQLLALKSYLLNADLDTSQPLQPALQAIFLEDKKLKLSYRNTYVGVVNSQSTFVPNRFFQAADASVYLKNQCTTSEEHQIFIDELQAVDAKNVYTFDREVFYLVKGFLPSARFFHNTTSLLQGFMKNQNGNNEKNVYVNVKGDHLQIALLEGKNLIFFNAYSYQTEHDFIYHVMLIYDQFNLSPENTPIYVSGQLTKDSKLFRIMYRFIKDVSLLKIPTTVFFGKNAEGIPPHFYFDLFSLELCG